MSNESLATSSQHNTVFVPYIGDKQSLLCRHSPDSYWWFLLCLSTYHSCLVTNTSLPVSPVTDTQCRPPPSSHSVTLSKDLSHTIRSPGRGGGSHLITCLGSHCQPDQDTRSSYRSVPVSSFCSLIRWRLVSHCPEPCYYHQRH